MRVVFQDQLLKVKEGAFVMDALSELDLRHPSMRCVRLFTVVALQIIDNKLNLESLLQHCVQLNFFLNGKFDFDSAGVRFGPDKGRV